MLLVCLEELEDSDDEYDEEGTQYLESLQKKVRNFLLVYYKISQNFDVFLKKSTLFILIFK